MNLNYLKQNLKKSKSFLAFFIGIIPIMTVLMLIVESQHKMFVPSLEELSLINYPCCYILPIIISVCLFGHVFKKKSVDFVNSMPISRKSLFITNTIGGIFLILLLNLINVILMFILSSTIANIVIPFSMLVDYFVFWTITYIFVFVCANVAISVSGNMITSIALTLLILFLIPFLHSYVMIKGAIINPPECITSINNPLTPVIDNNYTAPYNFIFASLGESKFDLYNKISLVKMIVLSIVYIFIGYVLFKRRKMEVSETSFKNINIHNFVKCLTLIPFIVIFYEVCSLDDGIITIILLVIMIAYYLIFDLITRKNISKLIKNLSFLALFLVVAYTVLLINDKIIGDSKIVVNIDDIKSINIVSYQYDNVYDFSNILKETKIEDKELIKNILNNSNTNNYTCSDYNTILLTTNKNKQYEAYACLDNKDLSSNDKIKKLYNNIDYNKIYALSINDKLVNNDKLLDEIRKEMSKITIDSNLDITRNYDSIILYSYIDNKQITYDFNYKLSKEIENIYLNEVNNQLINNIDNIEIFSATYNDKYIDIKQVKELIKANKIVDSSKEYITINIYTSNGLYNYNTNDINGINMLNEVLND